MQFNATKLFLHLFKVHCRSAGHFFLLYLPPPDLLAHFSTVASIILVFVIAYQDRTNNFPEILASSSKGIKALKIEQTRHYGS